MSEVKAKVLICGSPDDSIRRRIESALRESIDMEANKILSVDTGTSTTAVSTALTIESLNKTVEYLKDIPEPEPLWGRGLIETLLPSQEEEDRMRLNWMARYNYGVRPPKRVVKIPVQRRTHRAKRINKKWLKRYGTKEVEKEINDYYGIIATSSGI